MPLMDISCSAIQHHNRSRVYHWDPSTGGPCEANRQHERRLLYVLRQGLGLDALPGAAVGIDQRSEGSAAFDLGWQHGRGRHKAVGQSLTDKAPFTKAWLIGVSAATVLASVFELKPFLPLHFDRVFVDAQVWRLITHHLAFHTSGEMLVGGLLIYAFRMMERRYGTAKFAAFVASSSGVSTLLQIGYLTLAQSLGYNLRQTSPGPRSHGSTRESSYAALFAVIVPYMLDVPITFTFNFGQIAISSKWFIYALALQIASVSHPYSAAPIITGLATGYLYWINAGGMQRWRVGCFTAAVKTLPRFPQSVQRLCQRFILPHLVAGTAPPASARAPLGSFDRRDPRLADMLGPRPGDVLPSAVVPATLLPPEEAIAALEGMGFSRAQAESALRMSGNDLSRAVDALLTQQG